MFDKINNLVVEHAIPKYLKRWEPVSDDSTLAEVRKQTNCQQIANNKVICHAM
jgi:hypothetical protein